jgi:hypothetical protein
MKKYLDNTLSRNKKDLKKFHHKWSKLILSINYMKYMFFCSIEQS